MTEEIFKETEKIFDHDKDILIRKNEEAFARYTSQSEQNYVRFQAISKELADRTTGRKQQQQQQQPIHSFC